MVSASGKGWQLTPSLADENPAWVAHRIARFLSEDTTPLADIDLSHLRDKATLKIGFYGTLRNAALAQDDS